MPGLVTLALAAALGFAVLRRKPDSRFSEATHMGIPAAWAGKTPRAHNVTAKSGHPYLVYTWPPDDADRVFSIAIWLAGPTSPVSRLGEISFIQERATGKRTLYQAAARDRLGAVDTRAIEAMTRDWI